MNINNYLYEIIEDYKDAKSDEEKAEVFRDFCTFLWGCKNKRRVYTRTIKFNVRDDLLETEIGQIFNAWSKVDYTNYKAITKDTDWCSLIRQKINNLYSRYCDEEIIIKKDYMDLLKNPKRLYYQWINGEDINTDELNVMINDSINKANELKAIYQKQKMHLSWNEYKQIVEGFLKKIFDRCKLVEDYEVENLTNERINQTNKYIYDFFNKDKSYIKYICKSLEGEMLNYQKEYYELKVPNTKRQHKKYKRCVECGKLIEIKSKKDFSTKYCKECRDDIVRKQTNERVKKYRKIIKDVGC